MTLSRDEATCLENTTPILSFQLYYQDNDGRKHKLHLSDLSTITVTYWNYITDAAINSRTAQDVKNTNNVVVSATGRVTWTLQTADTAAIDTTLSNGVLERHDALFQWATSAALGSRKGKALFSVYVEVHSKAS